MVPRDEWIVAIDASTTLTTNQSQFTYGAATVAVDGGTLRQSGFRLKLEGLGGNYGYDQSGVRKRAASRSRAVCWPATKRSGAMRRSLITWA